MGGPPGKPTKPLNPQTAKRVMASFTPYAGYLIVICIAVLISAGVGLLQPYFLRIIIDQGLQASNMGVVATYSFWTIVATLAATAFSLAYGYLSVIVGQRIMRDFRLRLFDHLQGMSLRFFTNARTGEIQSRLLADVAGVQSVLSDTAASILSNVATVLSTLVAMLFLDWRLTLLAIGMLPLFAFLAAKVGSYAGGVRKRGAELNADLGSTMQETLSVSGALLTKNVGAAGIDTGALPEAE